jgi:hypothetical protein
VAASTPARRESAGATHLGEEADLVLEAQEGEPPLLPPDPHERRVVHVAVHLDIAVVDADLHLPPLYHGRAHGEAEVAARAPVASSLLYGHYKSRPAAKTLSVGEVDASTGETSL